MNEHAVQKQIVLLSPMLDYCDVRDMFVRCGSEEEADAVGAAVIQSLEGRIAYVTTGPTLRLYFVAPEDR